MLSLPVLVSLLATPAVDCPPAVVVSGALQSELAEALRRREVEVPPPAGCTGLAVQAEPGEGGVRLNPESDASRVVPDVETAALLVETWVRAELIDPLLAARRGPPPPPTRLVTVGLGLDGGGSSDRTTWLAARGEGCITLGALCPGVRMRVIYDPGVSGPTRREDVWRLGMVVLATTDLMLGSARLGLGAGLALARSDGRAGVDDRQGGFILEARADYALPIGELTAIDLGAAFAYGLWPSLGQRNADPLPDMPQWMVLGGAGVRWSVP